MSAALRIGLGYDVHAFGGVGPLVLGGVTISDSPALSGHSDGDAVAHAVADALLGAAGLPDLGTMFPATELGAGVASFHVPGVPAAVHTHSACVLSQPKSLTWAVSPVGAPVLDHDPTHREEPAPTSAATPLALRLLAVRSFPMVTA